MAARDVEANERMSILENTRDVKDLPADIRLSFIKKVYGLVGYMLLITFSITTPFIFQQGQTETWLKANLWFPMTFMAAFMCLYMFNICMVGSAACCRSTWLLDAYLTMFKTFPSNVLFLTFISCLFGVMVGFICLQYTANSVCFIFLLCTVIIAALTAYAVYTNCDFSGCGGYILCAILGLMLMGLTMSLFGATAGGPMDKVYAGVGAIIFGFIIIYETQLIFGQSPWGGQREHQYTVDAYAFAAYQLYLSYINFLIMMLRLLGDRR